MSNAAFAIRLSVDGARQAGAELRGVPEEAAKGVKTFGDSAERAGRQTRGLRTDTSNVTPTMRALDSAVKGVRGEFENFAGRIPIIGSSLAAIGPAGLAASAGVVAIGAGLATMLRQSQLAIQQLGDLKDRAQELSLSTTQLQGIRGAGLLEGISVQTTDSILATFATNSARASEGFGKMYAALQKVNPELAEQIRLATTQAERLDVVTAAIQQATTHNEKLNIAVAAFGAEGAQMIRVMDESGASIETWQKRAQAAGLVVEESLIEAADEVGKRMDLMAAQTEVAGQRLAIAFAGVNEYIEEQKRNQALGWSMVLEEMNAVQLRAEWVLRVRAQRDKELIAAGNDWFGIAARRLAEINAELERRAALAANISDAAQRATLPADLPKRFDVLNGDPGGQSLDPEFAASRAAADAARAEQDRKAAEAARLRAGYEREAIQLRGELGDITGLLAAREKELGVIVAANVGLTREMAEQVLKRYRESLDGTATAQARWQSVIEAARSPLQRVYDELALLTHEFTQGKVDADVYRQAHAALTAQLKETAAAEANAAAATRDSAAASNEAQDAFGRTAEQLGEVRRASLEVELGMAGIIGLLDEQIEGWEDAERVGLRVLLSISTAAMQAAAQIQGANLGSIIAAGFGVFMGGWGGPGSSGYTDPALGAYPAGSYETGGSFHVGGIVGMPAPMSRTVPSSVFHDAPRNHRGYPLAPDERAVIAQVGEPIVAKWDANRIMRAVERGDGAGAGVNIKIINQSGGDVKTRESRGPGGTREVEIMILEVAAKGLASGDLDAPMRSRYQLQPATR